MAKEKFEDRRLTGKISVSCKYEDGTVRVWDTDKETVIAHIIYIVNLYAKQGYVLTLRQLHYQMVTRNWIINHDSAYKRLGGILDDCRYGGLIDWDSIEDRGRVPYLPYHVDNATEAVQDTIDYFRIDRQERQVNMVELWTEKDALSGILKRTTEKYHIRLVVNKGYTSSSAIYNAYSRSVSAIKAGQKFTILYFGDHDPSGLDMVRDIRDRLTFMLCNGDRLVYGGVYDIVQEWWTDAGYDLYGMVDNGHAPEEVMELLRDYPSDKEDKLHKMFDAGRIKWYLEEKDLFRVIPIGLTMEQIELYDLPPNPTKLTDSRAKEYISKFGKTCWEVDALNPQTLTEVVEEKVTAEIDMELFQESKEREQIEKRKLEQFKTDNLI